MYFYLPNSPNKFSSGLQIRMCTCTQLSVSTGTIVGPPLVCGLLRHILVFPMRDQWLGATEGSVMSGLDQQPSSHDT